MRKGEEEKWYKEFREKFPTLIELIKKEEREAIAEKVQKYIEAYHYDNYRVGIYKEVLDLLQTPPNEEV